MKDLLKFSLSLETSSGTWHKLTKHFSSADHIYGSTFEDLKSIVPQASPLTIKNILKGPNLKKTEDNLNYCQENNIQILSFYSSDYPSLLKKTQSPPSYLFIRGSLHSSCISIIGTRKPSHYGLKVTQYFCDFWKKENIHAISGMALGIDQYCHQLMNSIGVLGSSLDCFLKNSSLLHQKMWEEQTLISEYPLGTRASSFSFPQRNRIIAGMSEATIIMEAQEKSGALITAKYAQKENRPIFAVSSNLLNPLSRGTDSLIQNGIATLLTHPEQAVPKKIQKPSPSKQNLPLFLDSLNSLQKEILTYLQQGKSIEYISNNEMHSPQDLFLNLSEMESLGIIKRKLGNQYCLI